MAFWNVAGLRNKDFWRGLEKCECYGPVRNMDEKGWEKIRGGMSKRVCMKGAKKINKRRVMGGMVMGIRKGIVEKRRESGGREGNGKESKDRKGKMEGNWVIRKQ